MKSSFRSQTRHCLLLCSVAGVKQTGSFYWFTSFTIHARRHEINSKKVFQNFRQVILSTSFNNQTSHVKNKYHPRYLKRVQHLFSNRRFFPVGLNPTAPLISAPPLSLRCPELWHLRQTAEATAQQPQLGGPREKQLG